MTTFIKGDRLQVTPVMCLTYEWWNPVSAGGTIDQADDKNGLPLVFKWKSADRRKSRKSGTPGLM
jgi:hypothetical protein